MIPIIISNEKNKFPNRIENLSWRFFTMIVTMIPRKKPNTFITPSGMSSQTVSNVISTASSWPTSWNPTMRILENEISFNKLLLEIPEWHKNLNMTTWSNEINISFWIILKKCSENIFPMKWVFWLNVSLGSINVLPKQSTWKAHNKKWLRFKWQGKKNKCNRLNPQYPHRCCFKAFVSFQDKSKTKKTKHAQCRDYEAYCSGFHLTALIKNMRN